ncbi:uncharacterized protein METZ01_LOCUS445792, partial [marine metagenome]
QKGRSGRTDPFSRRLHRHSPPPSGSDCHGEAVDRQRV